MRITVLGAGYVGLVTGACFADSGNDVACVDIDPKKIDALNQGKIPIYEPGLAELVERNLEAGRLRFTTDVAEAAPRAELVLLAVGTPAAADGAADLGALRAAVDGVAPYLADDAIVAIKSTVPVGTNEMVAARLRERTGRDCDVVSNPEFLKEGAAIEDFIKPDRVIVGVRRAEVAEPLRTLYAPYLRTEKPFLVMTPESAEMSKYVSNAMLATKISFINEIANLCELLGADINDVRRGIGHDSRIGFAFLFPGVGYGGSCFPKDIRALRTLARQRGFEPQVLDAVDAVNARQQIVLLEKIEQHFDGRLAGVTIALWGLSFKPRTDDVREAPALALADRLLAGGARLQVHDPEALDNVRAQYGDRLEYHARQYDALRKADALVVMTEWKQFIHADFERMRSLMKSSVVFDGRNIYEPQRMQRAGFTYYSIGRKTVEPT